MTPQDELANSIEERQLPQPTIDAITGCAYELVGRFDTVTPEQIPAGLSFSTFIALVGIDNPEAPGSFVLAGNPMEAYTACCPGWITFRTIIRRVQMLDGEGETASPLNRGNNEEIMIDYNTADRTAIIRSSVSLNYQGNKHMLYGNSIKGLWLFTDNPVEA